MYIIVYTIVYFDFSIFAFLCSISNKSAGLTFSLSFSSYPGDILSFLIYLSLYIEDNVRFQLGGGIYLPYYSMHFTCWTLLENEQYFIFFEKKKKKNEK